MLNLLLKRITFLTFLSIFCSCTNSDLPNINGMWQLKSAKDTEGNIYNVDTIFYSFQRQSIFSYTLLENKDTAIILYGYIDFPSNNLLHIKMDKKNGYSLNYLPWKSEEITYEILKLSSSELILSCNDSIYNFKKF